MNAKLYLPLFTLVSYTAIHSMETPSKTTMESEALYYADLNEEAIVNKLLDQGLDPNTKDSGTKMSLLHYTAKNGNLSLSERLLKHPQFNPANATLSENNDYYNYVDSPFKLALKYKQLAIAKCILTIAHINLDEVVKIYSEEACDNNTDILTDILSLNIDHQKLPRFLSQLLYNASWQKQIVLAEMLLQHKDTDVNYKQFSSERTPLCLAASYADIPMMQLLLAHKAQLGEVLNNATDLHIMRFLIDQGADLKVKEDHGYTLLAQTIGSAKGKTCADIVQLLLNRGIDVNEEVDNDGNVALGFLGHWASNSRQAVDVLLAHPKIDVNKKTKKIKHLWI